MLKYGKRGMVLWSIYGSDWEIGYCQAGIVDEVIYPENSGCLTKLRGCSYLYKGFPGSPMMKQLELSKDVSWLVVNILKLKIIAFACILMYLLRRKWAIKMLARICDAYFKIAYEPIVKQDFLPNEHEWCVSVKEYYKASIIALDTIKNEQLRGIFKKFRDIALLIPEMDTAYRFTAQDIIPEINLPDFEKNPRKEIGRMFDLLIRREKPGDQREKWKRVKKMVLTIMLIPRIRKLMKVFFQNLDYEKVKMDEADRYFTLGHHCYEYQDVPYQERLEQSKKIDAEKGHQIPRLKFFKEPTPHFEIIGYGL